MIEDALLQYGMAGIFILYLIFDRQVLLKSITKAINDLSVAIAKLK